VVARGGWVVRLGDASMGPTPRAPGLIDYAHSPLKSPWMDVFLCAACRFFVGVASGLSHVPGTFGVPCVLTNWVLNPLPVASARNLFTPKLLWSDRAKRFLGFLEALAPGTRRLGYCGQRLAEKGLRAVDNTGEEIRELVREMFDLLGGTGQEMPEDDRRQRAFRDVAHSRGLAGFCRIGRAFLRRHADLLPPEQGECPRAA
jgi:putative glycosyltransferase (TIGR04372 family)